MKKKDKRNNKINKVKFLIIFIAATIIMCVVLRQIFILVKNPTNIVVVKQGTIAEEENNIGYIIRNEKIVKGENYKNGMEQIISEGQKVSKNEAIFRYYSNNEQEVKNKIQELDTEIEKTMEQQQEQIFSSDTKLLDTQIDEKLNTLNKLNNIQSIQESKKNINDYIMKKAEIIGDLSPKGSKLKELINQRSDEEKKLLQGAEYINAPESGLVSYKIDGLEETLTGNDFSKYNKDFLNSLNLKTGKIISTSTEQGKIVDISNCYIAFTSKSNEANKAEVGDNVKIVLPSTKEVKAKVQYIIKENDNESTIVLSFSEGIDELLNYRKISFDIIWWDASGYKVPKSSIITQNNLKYVIRNKSGYFEKVLIKEVKSTENYSIITNYSTSELKDLNADKSAKTSILLYDEIILKPTEEQINSTN